MPFTIVSSLPPSLPLFITNTIITSPPLLSSLPYCLFIIIHQHHHNNDCRHHSLLCHIFSSYTVSFFIINHPLLFSIQAIILANIIKWNGIKYDGVAYPWWAELLGWAMCLSSIMLIPLMAIHEIYKTPGTLREVHLIPIYTLSKKRRLAIWNL